MFFKAFPSFLKSSLDKLLERELKGEEVEIRSQKDVPVSLYFIKRKIEISIEHNPASKDEGLFLNPLNGKWTLDGKPFEISNLEKKYEKLIILQ